MTDKYEVVWAENHPSTSTLNRAYDAGWELFSINVVSWGDTPTPEFVIVYKSIR